MGDLEDISLLSFLSQLLVFLLGGKTLFEYLRHLSRITLRRICKKKKVNRNSRGGREIDGRRELEEKEHH